MKLWRVEVAKTLYVLAENEDEAEATACHYLDAEDSEPYAFAHPLSSVDMADDSIMASMPWTSRRYVKEMTIGEWVEVLEDDE